MDPISAAIGIVKAYVLSNLEKTDPRPDFEVYVVWFAFTLGHWKALVSTSLSDGMYYEVTHNTASDEIYLDAYKKFQNVKLEGPWDWEGTPLPRGYEDITSVTTETVEERAGLNGQ